LQKSKSFSSIKGVPRDVGLSVKSLEALKFDKIQNKKPSCQVKQLPLKREESNFKREAGSLRENVGDKQLSTWK